MVCHGDGRQFILYCLFDQVPDPDCTVKKAVFGMQMKRYKVGMHEEILIYH